MTKIPRFHGITCIFLNILIYMKPSINNTRCIVANCAGYLICYACVSNVYCRHVTMLPVPYSLMRLTPSVVREAVKVNMRLVGE